MEQGRMAYLCSTISGTLAGKIQMPGDDSVSWNPEAGIHWGLFNSPAWHLKGDNPKAEHRGDHWPENLREVFPCGMSFSFSLEHPTESIQRENVPGHQDTQGEAAWAFMAQSWKSHNITSALPC